MRAEAATAPVGVWRKDDYLHRANREIVLRALVRQLATDADDFVQKTAYRQIIKAMKPAYLSENDLPDYFNRDTDVDWELLKPLLPEDVR